jgi:hypothetical protein
MLLVSVGVTPEYEHWQNGDENINLRATVRLQAEVALSDVATVGLDATYTPVLDRPYELRMFGNAFVEVEITPELLAFRVTASDEYDTEPQPGIERNNLSVISSLVFKLAR